MYDELNSTFDESLDVPATNTWLQRHVPGGTPIDLAQSMSGACATVHKFSHLLHESFVLGATGNLNPLRASFAVSDDGVGIEPGTAQARLTIRTGPTTTEVLPWTIVQGTVIGPKTTRHLLGLYRDGALAIPQLATTEGEYHLELRARDLLGRTSLQERCWNHRILAPKPSPVGSGAKAKDFEGAMYSPKLELDDADFAERFLNSNAEGAAVWVWRVKNYLATPVYVTVDISRGVDVSVSRTFVLRNGLTNYHSSNTSCGSRPCTIGVPQTLYTGVLSGDDQNHRNVKFRARFFVMNGDATGAEIGPCAGCINDDENQIYTFEIPPRSTPQGVPLVEYAILTHLRPTLPIGAGTNVKFAPSDMGSPDNDPRPYGEFTLNGKKLTGKLVGGLGVEVCTSQELEAGEWMCTEKANRQQYRAVLSVIYDWKSDVETVYAFSTTATSPGMRPLIGTIDSADDFNTTWSSQETSSLP